MDDQLVTVLTLKDAGQAEGLRIALENDGIRCRVYGEVNALMSGVADYRIVVHASDADKAREAIAFHRGGDDDLAEDEILADNPDSEQEEGIELDFGEEP